MIKMTVNERVRSVRHALNLTQMKFSKQISISTSYLAGIEIGDRKVNERVIRLIGSEFNINEHWLKTGDGEMFSEDVDASIAKITSLFKSLSPQFQMCALEQMDTLFELEQSLKS